MLRSVDDRLDTDAAEGGLVLLSLHLPVDVEIGRPLVARLDDEGMQLLTTITNWWVEAHRAVRIMWLDDGRAEYTAWSGRQETQRFIGSVS